MADSDGALGGFAALAVVGLLIWSCSGDKQAERTTAQQAVMSGDAAAPSGLDAAAATFNPVRADFNEDRAGEAAREELSSETFEGTQGSATCTDDCSGHEAGWQWAKDGNSCGDGDSPSFDEGCAAFVAAVEEKVEEARSRYEAGEDAFAGED